MRLLVWIKTSNYTPEGETLMYENDRMKKRKMVSVFNSLM